MSFIAGIGYFVSLGNYNTQACFSLLDADISELLTTAPAHVDRHIWPEIRVVVCTTFVVVYVGSTESLDIDLCLSLVCSPGRKPESRVKCILWVAVCNKMKWQEMGFFSYLRFKKKKKKLQLQGASPSDPHRGRCPWTPPGPVCTTR